MCYRINHRLDICNGMIQSTATHSKEQKFIKALFPKSFADTDLSTIKNFKVEPLKTEIPIDEPENGKLDFHYPEDYVRN